MALRVSREPSMAEVIRVAMEHRIADLRVAMPGRVVSYDATTQLAEVQPLIKLNTITPNGSEIPAEDLPILSDVPVIFPRSGSFFLTFPIQPGDSVLLVICDRSIDKWYSGDGSKTVDPKDLRMNDVSDAVAYPGMYPASKSLVDSDSVNLLMGHDEKGMQLKIEAEKSVFQIQDKLEQAAIIGEQLKAYIDSLIQALNVHTHPTGVGPSGPPQSPFSSYDSGLVHSDHVKLPGNG